MNLEDNCESIAPISKENFYHIFNLLNYLCYMLSTQRS